MTPAGWKLFGHAMFELSQLNVTEVAKFVQRNFQNLFTKAAPPGKQIQCKRSLLSCVRLSTSPGDRPSSYRWPAYKSFHQRWRAREHSAAAWCRRCTTL